MSTDKALLKTARDLRLSKRLSQNFLVDGDCIAAIAAAVNHPDETALPIVEIGPGAGFLTAPLLATGRSLTAIEVDSKMVRVLEDRFRDVPNWTLLHQDIRRVDLMPLLGERGTIVGNLPYHLTGPILFQILGELAEAHYPLRQHLASVTLMVQKEVGDRLVAKPGETAYSQLTLQAQYWFTVEPVCAVPRGAFYPSPDVDSAVVRLVPRPAPAVDVKDLTALSRLIKAVFKHRRKTMANNLKLGGYGPDPRIQSALGVAGIEPGIRPQCVSIAQFGALSDVLLDR